MARIRTIKPEFWADEDLSALPVEAHMLAAALLNYADDEGYFNANPKLVEAACRPLREDSVSVHECLKHLSNVGYLDIGEGSDGKKYGCIRNFAKHQRINRPSESKIAKLSITWDGSRSAHGGGSEGSHPEGNREQGTGKGTGNGTPPADDADENRKRKLDESFEQAWSDYPKRAGGNSKRDARKAWEARVKAGADPDDILAGVQRYAAFCRITGKTGTEFVKQGATFFGPSEHYLDDWTPPPPDGKSASNHTGFSDHEYTEHLPDWAKEA